MVGGETSFAALEKDAKERVRGEGTRNRYGEGLRLNNRTGGCDGGRSLFQLL